MNQEQKREMQQLIRETVAETVPAVIESVLERFGIDTKDANETQQDFAHLHRLRRGSELVKSTAIKTCVGTLITGTLFIGVLGLREWILSIFTHGGPTP